MLHNATGDANVASGYRALYYATGNNNTALGSGAGFNVTTGSYNIHIGSQGTAIDTNVIRIGTPGTHTSTFIAGIYGATTGGAGIPVVVDSNGQLGTISSSRRYKDDIADMNEASAALMKLRPVTFHYKTDRNPAGRTLQYGLIAEEVAALYPGLVARSADGRIETVLYQFLPPMLLNEFQRQQRTIDAQAAEMTKQAVAMAKQTARIAELEQDRLVQTARAMELEKDRRVQTARIDALEQQTSEIAALKQQMARMNLLQQPAAWLSDATRPLGPKDIATLAARQQPRTCARRACGN